ncbi:MAG: BlaI/MecI/CopY family transcriptional regulator [Candidatus Krumholzibacteriota bacterium]|nr:BlaI/MecI/CopY family transcriptional regulator [Candidatus Krumholzibacteriota bacterium]
MKNGPKISELTKRERQIMEIIYKLGSSSASEIVDILPGNAVNATVRTMLGVLEEKGYLFHETVKGKFIYKPTIPLGQARKNALDHLMDSFFEGSEASAVISILKRSDARLTDADKEMILELIKNTRKEGR